MYCPNCTVEVQPTRRMLRNWCPLCRFTIHKPVITEVQPGSIPFYERVRPIFDQACDRLGLPPRLAQRIDGNLFFTICSMGPTAEAIEAVLNRVVRQGNGQVVESLDELLDLADHEEDSDVLAQQLEALRRDISVDWGLPPERYTGPVPHAAGQRSYLIQLVMLGRKNQDPMICEVCNKADTVLYAVPRFKGQTEVCNGCLAAINAKRREKGKRDWTLDLLQTRYWEVLHEANCRAEWKLP